ncbi:STAS/SEC14 domain-containing protein [Gloeocapsopsis sp. IPPAS B-1203]|uniref:STAS/SEC14 domain-containing protein n=1 Tax=Gloeocapsopsis sp. IPPAS B-1203 TaxID=2049454 RepID=UPI0025A0F7FF|nr:STAS/SEC14 domain-containing protein [Gloeocapsopsis sp. IPPAS B-1203]
MLTITEKIPIITFTYEGRMTMDDANQYISKLEELITQKEPFAILAIAHEDNSKNREKGVNSTIGKWIKYNKPQLTKFCFGYATVTTSTVFALYKPMTKLIGTKMMGCPCDVFVSVEEAIAWLEQQKSHVYATLQ